MFLVQSGVRGAGRLICSWFVWLHCELHMLCSVGCKCNLRRMNWNGFEGKLSCPIQRRWLTCRVSAATKTCYGAVQPVQTVSGPCVGCGNSPVRSWTAEAQLRRKIWQQCASYSRQNERALLRMLAAFGCVQTKREQSSDRVWNPVYNVSES